MTQRDRDRGRSERNVRRLLKKLKVKGDQALVHASRGRQSNRKLDDKTRQAALQILSGDVYAGFGPSLASEYLAEKHDIHAGRETVRAWMIEGKLWRASKQPVGKIHQWRARRSRLLGKLVQWVRAITNGWRAWARGST